MAMERPPDASSAYVEGRRSLEELPASIPDEDLRAGFLERAGAMFPETEALQSETKARERRVRAG